MQSKVDSISKGAQMAMSFLRFFPIKRKIMFSYIVLLIIPLLLVSVFIYIQTSSMIENKSVRQFQTISQYANQQFDQYVLDIENLSVNILENARLQFNLQQPFKAPKDWSTRDIASENEMRAFLNGIYKLKPGISSILVYGFNGIHYYYHPVRRWDDSFDGTKEDWFQNTIQLDGKWTLSGRREERQLFSTLDPEPEQVVTFSRMIKDLNTFQPIGVLTVNIKLEMLETLAGVHSLKDQLLIMDSSGTPILSSDEIAGEQTGVDWLQVSSVSEYTGWKSVFMISKDELFKESKEIRNYIIILTFVLFVAALILANVLSSGIVKPLLKLRKKMKEMEKGEFTALDVAIRRDEIGELAVGFNRMVERVRQLVDEIRIREKLRMQMELDALQARINPHFMYNTLNGIRWAAMMEGNGRVTDMITSLVYLLQFSAKNADPLIPVKKELEMLQHYITLMKLRNDQFDFELDVEEDLSDHLIIPFLLQPVVENAIFHGIIPLKKRGRIEVRLFTQRGFNVATVKDNGIGMEQSTLESLLSKREIVEGSFNKIGIVNVYDRLKLQFGEAASLVINSHVDEGTEVRISWPILHIEENPS